MSNPWRLFILDCDSSIKPEAKEWGISKQIIWTLFIVVNIDLILGINMIIAILGKKWWKQKLRIEYSNVTLLRISDKCSTKWFDHENLLQLVELILQKSHELNQMPTSAFYFGHPFKVSSPLMFLLFNPYTSNFCLNLNIIT